MSLIGWENGNLKKGNSFWSVEEKVRIFCAANENELCNVWTFLQIGSTCSESASNVWRDFNRENDNFYVPSTEHL